MAAKKVVVDERVIKIQTQMDSMIEDIRGIDLKKAELEALFDAKVQLLKDSFSQKIDSLNSNRDYLVSEIKTLFEQVPQSVTKTQRKVSLLSGDCIVKNATQKLEADKNILLDHARLEVKKHQEIYDEAVGTYESSSIMIDDLVATGDVGDEVSDKISRLASVRDAAWNRYKTAGQLLEDAKAFIDVKTVESFKWAEFKSKLAISDGTIVDTETGAIVNEGVSIVDVPEEVVIK